MKTFKKSEGFITTKEAALLTPCTLNSVRYWCKKHANKGLAFKHANKWYLHKDSYLKED